MLVKFKKYIAENHLFLAHNRLLVAVSGGVDSVTLCFLLKQADYDFDIAHANFQLRGEESDADDIFVENLAAKLDVYCHKKRFDTEGYVLEKKVSIQEAARTLRYQWFDELCQQFDYQCVATAHHASDDVETALFNLSRGAGLHGLRGILPKSGRVVHPLLWATKAEIIAFSDSEKIEYRNDASNETDKYTRNFIRHHIMPKFRDINPNFDATASQSLARLRDAEVLLDFFIEKTKVELTQTIDNQTFIDLKKLKTYPSVSTLLFEILKDYGFNGTQVEQIAANVLPMQKIGAKFYSATFELLIDREQLIVRPFDASNVSDTNTDVFDIFDNTRAFVGDNFHLFFETTSFDKTEILTSLKIASLDFDRLTFPLHLRKAKVGDRFQPFGMNGKSQLLSDFFRLKKLSVFQKQDVWVLETSSKDICWVIGWRIDERFKITEGCQQVLKITLQTF